MNASILKKCLFVQANVKIVLTVFLFSACQAGRCLAVEKHDSTAASAAVKSSAAYLGALNSITVNTLKDHVDYLADDALQGRKSGTPGGHAAGEYIAAEFQKYNLRTGDVSIDSGADGQEANDEAVAGGDYFQPFAAKYRNVLAILPGSDAELKKEIIVVGAHYDHLGSGAAVYNGADDNASGTAALLELAEAFSLLPQPPRRTIIFAAWDGEESGLLGSGHWLRYCELGNCRVVFVFNMDMVGRLRDEKLTVRACRSGYGLRRLVSSLNSSGLTLEFPGPVKRCSDHWTFFNAGIPVMMFNTGLHDQVHTVDDDAELINNEGMGRVARLAFETVVALADGEKITEFRDASRNETAEPAVCDAEHHAASPAEITTSRDGGAEPLAHELDGKPLRLGIFWQEDDSEPGTAVLTYVVPQMPAARAGLQPGDRIYAVNGREFKNDEEFFQLVKICKVPLTLQVERDGKLRTVQIRPDGTALKRAA